MVVTALRVSVSSGAFGKPVELPVTYWSAEAAAMTAPPSDRSGPGTVPADG